MPLTQNAAASRVGGGGGVLQGPEFSPGDCVRQGGGVAAKHVDVLEAERREVRDILGKNFVAFRAELIERGVHIDGVPQDHEVDDYAQRAELIFLPFAVTLPKFAPLSMKDDARKLMASLYTVELNKNAQMRVETNLAGSNMTAIFQVEELVDSVITSVFGIASHLLDRSYPGECSVTNHNATAS